MREEIWKDIKGFEGKYMVSNLGRVKSLNYNNTGKEGILKAHFNVHGYLFVVLYKEGKRKLPLVHRLVATAFLENPDNLPEVNHKNEDKTDNRVDNLEYCSRSYNINYGTRNKRSAEKLKGKKHSEETIKKIAEKMTNNPKLSKPVYSVDKESGLIMWWQSASEAERCTGINKSSITQCCQGKRKSAGGHIFFYAD